MTQERYIDKISNGLSSHEWIGDNLLLETRAGSFLYGSNLDDNSDIDVRGVFVPPYEMVFPFSGNREEYIYGFGTQPIRYDMFNKIVEPYDIIYFNIVKYFDLLLGSNPNVFPFLFLRPDQCTVWTPLAQKIYDNREKFLSKKIFLTYNGFANKCMKNAAEGKKPEKSMYVALRTLYELQSICRNYREIDFKVHCNFLLDVRRGAVSFAEVESLIDRIQIENTILEINSPWPETIDEMTIRNLLWECLNEFYAK